MHAQQEQAQAARLAQLEQSNAELTEALKQLRAQSTAQQEQAQARPTAVVDADARAVEVAKVLVEEASMPVEEAMKAEAAALCDPDMVGQPGLYHRERNLKTLDMYLPDTPKNRERRLTILSLVPGSWSGSSLTTYPLEGEEEDDVRRRFFFCHRTVFILCGCPGQPLDFHGVFFKGRDRL